MQPLTSVLCTLCTWLGLLLIGLERVTQQQRALDGRLIWQQINVTGLIIFQYLGTKDLAIWQWTDRQAHEKDMEEGQIRGNVDADQN
eukprot:3817411-Ditylum_brightwellii.AAC.1